MDGRGHAAACRGDVEPMKATSSHSVLMVASNFVLPLTCRAPGSVRRPTNSTERLG